MVEHGFTATDVTRIWAGTVTSNTASRATLSRLGMECTDEPLPGVLTYAMAGHIHPGKRVDFRSVKVQSFGDAAVVCASSHPASERLVYPFRLSQ